MILAQAVTETASRGSLTVLGLLIVGFLLLGGLALIALLIALVVNRKTRPIGLVVVGVVGLIGGVLLLYMIIGVSSSRTIHQQAHAHAYPRTRQHTQSKSGTVSIRELENFEKMMADLNGQPSPSAAHVSLATDDAAEETDTATESDGENSAEPPAEDAAATDDGETDPPETVGDDKPITPAATPAELKPDWVTSPPERVGSSFNRVIRSDPFATVEECHRHLDQLMVVATAVFLRDFLGTEEYTPYFDNIDRLSSRYRRSKPRLERIGVTSGFIRRAICKKEFVETDVHDFGEMKTVYVLMEFDADAQADLRRRWNDSKLEDRLVVVGVGSSAVLLLLSTVFGLFKLDTATKGYYTKRLIFGALLVTMAVGSIVLVVVDEFTRYL